VNRDITDRIYGSFDGNDRPSHLRDLCRGLLLQQQGSWPDLKRAYDSLKNIRSRYVECDGFSVRLIFNPGRAMNTTAAVNPEAIRDRPCFLCTANLPGEQKGIIYRNEYLVLSNPRPALPSHLTIAHLSHRPQAIREHMEAFLRITADLGPGFSTLYNGPRCGASAPDHLHFQAMPSGQAPIEKELVDSRHLVPLHPGRRDTPGISLRRGCGFGRQIVLIEGDEARAVAAAFRDYMNSLAAIAASKETSLEEPMVNVAGSFNGNVWRVLVFPRRAHRPAAFYRQDGERIVVSPAVMEMAGVIVTPMERDFDRLDAAAIESIYREVSLVDN